MSIEWTASTREFSEYEESVISTEHSNLFTFSAEPDTGNSVEVLILSSTLPSSINVAPDYTNGILKITGITPIIINKESYYVVARLQEYSRIGGNKVIHEYIDAYFTINVLVKVLEWNPEYQQPLKLSAYANTAFYVSFATPDKYLIGLNGNETFRKIGGELPPSITLNKNGVLQGTPMGSETTYDPKEPPEEPIRYRDPYTFNIGVYRDNVETLTGEVSIEVEPERKDIPPTWITESGNICTINKGEKTTDTKVIAIINYDESDNIEDRKIVYELVNGSLPNGLTYTEISSSNQCIISGTCLSSLVAKTPFTLNARRKYKGVWYGGDPESDDPEVRYSNRRTFSITTNTPAVEHVIEWNGDSNIINAGTYAVGDVVNTFIPLATVTDGSTITYEIVDKDEDFPTYLTIGKDGSLVGTIEVPTNDNGYKTYSCSVRASTPYTYIIKTVQITIEEGLGRNAINLSLNINLEYRDQYNEIRDQLNQSALYDAGENAYTVNTFPKVDIATLTCFDREVLASIFNYGRPEKLRFLDTRYATYSDEDTAGNPTETYEVYYKAVDEQYYQWDEINNGNFDFETELEKQKQITSDWGDETTTKPSFYPMESEAKLEFNNETSIPNPENQTQWVKDSQDEDLYRLGKVDISSYLDSYPIFNIPLVREKLQTPIYVYKKDGDYYFDMGNQQLFEKDGIAIKKLKEVIIKNHLGEEIRTYHICDMDDSNDMEVLYDFHNVYDTTNNLITDVLFKPEFDTHQFMISSEDNEIYYLEEISNPWCIDREDEKNNWLTFDKVPEGKEIVLPRISDSDVKNILEERNEADTEKTIIKMLDTSKEPLPKWKRKSAIYWEAETTYNVDDVLYYDSKYYKVIQKYTTGYSFEYDSEYMTLLTNDEVKELLSKKYFPTLDLGYYQTGKNRKYLRELNAAEKKGQFWYRKDFLFWEVTCTPVYNISIETFGVPFVPMYDTKEDVYSTDSPKTFEIICDTPNATVSICVDGVNIVTASPEIQDRYNYKHVDNSYEITVDYLTTVDWAVTADETYYPQSGSETIMSNVLYDVTLLRKVIVSVNSTPADASVKFIASGYKQEGDIIAVPEGTTVKYYVSHPDYFTKNGTIVARYGMDPIDVELVWKYAELTIDISPEAAADAEVKFIIDGRTYEGSNTIRVVKGSTVDYYVNKWKWTPANGRVVVTEDTTIPVELELMYMYSVRTLPAGAKVTLTAPGYLQENNYIIVRKDTMVTCVVSCDGYYPDTNIVKVDEDKEELIQLIKKCNFTIDVKPNDALVEITYGGTTYITKTVTVPERTVISWSVTADHYQTQSGEEQVFDNVYKDITLVLDNHTVEVRPMVDGVYDQDAVVTFTVGEEVTVANEITVPYGTELRWAVTKDHYQTVHQPGYPNQGYIVESDSSFDAELILENYTLTINPTPWDTVITFRTAGIVSGNMITVPYGTTVEWDGERTGYVSDSGSYTVYDNHIEPFALTRENYTFSIIPYPEDALVEMTYNGRTYETNTVTVPYETEVEWSVSKEGWEPEDGEFFADHNELNKEVTLLELFTVQIIKSPQDAVVTFTVDGEEIVADSITVPDGTEITWSITKEHFVPAYNDEYPEAHVVAGNETIEKEIFLEKHTLRIIPDPDDAFVTLTLNGIEYEYRGITQRTVNYGTPIDWKVELLGWETQTGTYDGAETIDVEVPLEKYYKVAVDNYAYTLEDGIMTLNEYTGNAANVVTPKLEDMRYRVIVDNYSYTDDNGVITLNEYTGTGANITTPKIEKE